MQQATLTQPDQFKTASTALETEIAESVDFSPAYLSVLGSALLAACGGNEDANGSTAVKSDSASANLSNTAGGYSPFGTANQNGVFSAVGFNNYPVANTPNDAARFLLQSQLHATDAEIAAVSSGSFATYLQQQFVKPVGQTGWDWLEARGYGVADSNNYFFSDYPATGMIWNQLFTSQDGMRKRVALALSEFFVASLNSAEFTWRSHAYAQYWDLLVKNAFGNFRQLLEDVTLSPAMGYYLNTKGNLKENAATGRLPDENYAREVMQLFTIGLHQLNLDGTEKLDSNGKKIETYTQNDVSNLARVFTGYDFDAPASERFTPIGQSYTVEGKGFTTRPMSFKATNHTTLSSSFLNAPTVSADNTNGIALKQTLDILFNHPNVGIFFGKQMIQRFVTSNPSPEYVARVASAFNNNGVGVRGDLKAVWTAIFLDDEARRNFLFSPSSTAPMPEPTDPGAIRNQQGVLTKAIRDLTFGKLREPMIRFIQWGRTFNLSPVSSTYEYWKIPDTSNAADALAQSPLRSPSVFNFFRPAFIPPGTVLVTKNAVAPEFQLVNETTVGGYLNFMQDVVRSGLRSYIDPAVPQASYPSNNGYKLHSAPTYFSELALVADPAALVKRINLLMAAGQISDSNQTLMINAIASMPINSTNATTLEGQRLDRVSAAILMIMASSEYLIQK